MERRVVRQRDAPRGHGKLRRGVRKQVCILHSVLQVLRVREDVCERVGRDVLRDFVFGEQDAAGYINSGEHTAGGDCFWEHKNM